MKSLILILFGTALFSCQSGNTTKIVREGEPDIYTLESSDQEMNAAIAKAQGTLSELEDAFKSDRYPMESFIIKVKFPTNEGYEHIWMSDITLVDSAFYGIVNNIPNNTTEVKFGDTVRIRKEMITDWIYSDQGKLRGGYTLRVILDRMPSEERKEFLQSYEYRIED